MNINLFNILHDLSNFGLIKNLAFLFSYPITYGVILSLVVWAFNRKEKKLTVFSVLFLSVISTWLASNALKFIFASARPYEELGFIPMYFESTFSFPSAHAAVFFALATTMLAINKRFAYILFVFSSLIALSRLILGVHYPVDILGGIVLGAVIGILFWEVV